ncbi:MAG: hypothetical protein IJ274_13600, partial [Lachnospiraceae bacterium]|nr:hypothetical protein [Lachnospiraceae bacterium]
MKTYKERTDVILEKLNIQKKKQQRLRATIGAGVSTCILALGLFLFIPFDTTPPEVKQYQA